MIYIIYALAIIGFLSIVNGILNSQWYQERKERKLQEKKKIGFESLVRSLNKKSREENAKDATSY